MSFSTIKVSEITKRQQQAKNEVIKCLEQGYFIMNRESWSGFNGRESRIENYCDLAFNSAMVFSDV
jgi:hypothetical protein